MNRQFPFIVTLMLAGLVVALPCDAAIIRLRRTAEVDSSLIRLGDIAEVYAESAEADAKLKGTSLQPAPLAGTSIRLTVSEIQSQLSMRGVAAGTLEMEGSSVVLVSRKRKPLSPAKPKVIHPGPSTRPQPSTAETPKPVRKTVSRRPLPSELSASDFRLAQDVVENLVQHYLDQAAPHWGTPKITPLLATSDAPRILKGRHGNLQILNGRMIDDEHFLLTLAVPETPTKVDQVGVKVRIMRRPRIYVPVRTVSKGEVLQKQDLAQIETDDARNGITDPAEIVGRQAVQPLRSGKAIRANQLKQPVLIKRGETVQVISRSGFVRVRAFFIANRDGRLGETIPLEALDGKERLLATVTGRLKVQIGDGNTQVEPDEPTSEQPPGLQVTYQN